MNPAVAAAAAGGGQFQTWGWALSMVWLVMGGGMWVMLTQRRRRSKKKGSTEAKAKTIEDPRNWPLVGMLPALVANLGSGYYEWMTEVLVANGGTFQFKGPWLWLVGGSRCQDTLVTADPRNVEHVLRHNFPNYPKGPDFTAIFHDLLGSGIFNADHDLWRMQRKTASLHLNSRACREFADQTLFLAAPQKLLPILRGLAAGGAATSAAIDFQDLMLRFTFDTISIVAFGEDTGCLKPHLPTVPFALAFETALECTSFRFSTPPSFWKLLRLLKIGWERQLPAALRQIDAYVQGVVDRRRAAAASGAADNDLISCFLRVQDEHTMDDKFLKDVIVNMLLAGRDTSALALSWFFWLLASHPEVEEKLVQEAREVLLPAAEASQLPPDDEVLHSREKLNRLVYLQAALSEALRLYPSVPTDFKYVMTDDTLPDGNKVLKGQRFIYSIYSMGRMESIWGADCRSFRPERWLLTAGGGSVVAAASPPQLANISPFQYTAFNAGPRTCLGKDMAYTLMKVVASAILLRYKVEVAEDQPKIVPKISPTLYMKQGMKVYFRPR